MICASFSLAGAIVNRVVHINKSIKSCVNYSIKSVHFVEVTLKYSLQLVKLNLDCVTKWQMLASCFFLY